MQNINQLLHKIKQKTGLVKGNQNHKCTLNDNQGCEQNHLCLPKFVILFDDEETNTNSNESKIQLEVEDGETLEASSNFKTECCPIYHIIRNDNVLPRAYIVQINDEEYFICYGVFKKIKPKTLTETINENINNINPYEEIMKNIMKFALKNNPTLDPNPPNWIIFKGWTHFIIDNYEHILMVLQQPYDYENMLLQSSDALRGLSNDYYNFQFFKNIPYLFNNMTTLYKSLDIASQNRINLFLTRENSFKLEIESEERHRLRSYFQERNEFDYLTPDEKEYYSYFFDPSYFALNLELVFAQSKLKGFLSTLFEVLYEIYTPQTKDKIYGLVGSLAGETTYIKLEKIKKEKMTTNEDICAFLLQTNEVTKTYDLHLDQKNITSYFYDIKFAVLGLVQYNKKEIQQQFNEKSRPYVLFKNELEYARKYGNIFFYDDILSNYVLTTLNQILKIQNDPSSENLVFDSDIYDIYENIIDIYTEFLNRKFKLYFEKDTFFDPPENIIKEYEKQREEKINTTQLYEML